MGYSHGFKAANIGPLKCSLCSTRGRGPRATRGGAVMSELFGETKSPVNIRPAGPKGEPSVMSEYCET